MAEELRGMGCTYLQGYHYARPLPREEFLRYAAEGQERAR
jgi:EAL domain-containing protein (putative c-di-GMP-specific phosphodiesterase class I)